MKSTKKSYSLSITSTASILFLILFLSTALVSTAAAENLTVHFIDVGQGDAILLEYGDREMLVDAGDNGKGDDVANFVKGEGITSLDYVVATHPHADHIGGMSVILDEFPIENFIDSGYPHTTKTYEDMLTKIDSKSIPFTTVKRGNNIDFASGITVEVLNPGSSYFTDDLNQNSVVLKVTDGQVSFLLMGDAGIEAENAIMNEGYEVDADILKVGHHGSRTASSATFISAVSPDVSVIEVGEGNEYGHPHTEALEILQKASTIYRTDYDGTVTVTTDGSTYTVTTENTPVLNPQKPVLPVANFNVNSMSGYAPLSVQFTDTSQYSTFRSWDVNNDGIEDSNEASFVYTYTSTGTYTAKLTAINANGTSSKTDTITVLEESNSEDNSESSNSDTSNNDSSSGDSSESSDSSGSSHSSSSGGGGGGSPEPAKNVQAKDTTKVFIPNGKKVCFNFTNDVTVVESISFESKKTMGKTTAIVEDLKGKSTLVSELPDGEVYKPFNIWVGNAGYGNSDNIQNAAVDFKVEKSWMQENSIDQSSVVLYKYNDGSEEWTELPVTLTDEDDDYLYFTAETPGYYSFVITGETGISTEPTAIFKGSVENDSDVTEATAENAKAPGFGIISGVVCLFCMFLYRIKGR